MTQESSIDKDDFLGDWERAHNYADNNKLVIENVVTTILKCTAPIEIKQIQHDLRQAYAEEEKGVKIKVGYPFTKNESNHRILNNLIHKHLYRHVIEEIRYTDGHTLRPNKSIPCAWVWEMRTPSGNIVKN